MIIVKHWMTRVYPIGDRPAIALVDYDCGPLVSIGPGAVPIMTLWQVMQLRELAKAIAQP